jgi:bifunctional UDP-N-acetylglucosamine pyrophosphorylase / glucosamine-1-phosphate N-acetyltransferase
LPHLPSAIVVLAAGRGTRMQSDVPKGLHEVGGRSLLDHVLHSANAVKPDHLAVVVGHDRERVRLAIAAIEFDLGRSISIVEQTQLRGSGDAVRCVVAAHLFELSGTMLVISGDVPMLQPATMQDLSSEHERSGAAVTVLTTQTSTPYGYGRIVRDNGRAITAIVEERDATPDQRKICEVNAGVYAFDTTFLTSGLSALTDNNGQGEFYLTGMIEIACRRGRSVRAWLCSDPWEVFGINNPEQLVAAEVEFSRRNRQG